MEKEIKTIKMWQKQWKQNAKVTTGTINMQKDLKKYKRGQQNHQKLEIKQKPYDAELYKPQRMNKKHKSKMQMKELRGWSSGP